MFFCGNTENKIGKLVEKKQWDKIKKKYLYADDAEELILAKECAKSDTDDSVNVLLSLLELGGDEVKIEALKSLGVVGNDHVVSTLQLMLSKMPAGDTPLRKQLMDTLHTIRKAS
ncbi:MAG: hypothetical protein E7256_16710 [Lachnospiraceae bacterium]|nr:hypothetical protein [Lachnospiraceae bacterium]